MKLFVQTPDDNPNAVELDIFITASSSLGTRMIGITGPKVSSKTNSLFGLTLSTTIGGNNAFYKALFNGSPIKVHEEDSPESCSNHWLTSITFPENNGLLNKENLMSAFNKENIDQKFYLC